MKRLRITILAILVMFVISGCSALIPGSSKTLKMNEEMALKVKVIRVSDADTFTALIRGKEESVRLIGIDCPESVHPDESRNSEEGKKASQYVKTLIDDKKVWIETDASERDRYGRILAYAWLDENTMLNALLLEKGYARVMTVPPNVRYEDVFLKIQKQARKEQRGFWKDYYKGEE